MIIHRKSLIVTFISALSTILFGQIRIVDFDEKPLKLIKSGAGVISLPPYSVNKISEICINSKQSKQTKKK